MLNLDQILADVSRKEHPQRLFGVENPEDIPEGILNSANKFGSQFSDNPATFLEQAAKKGIDTFLYPFKVTNELLSSFGKDVVNKPGGMMDQMAARNKTLGPITNTALSALEGAAKGSAVVGAGVMAGEAYQAFKKHGFPMGLYVLDEWTRRAKDPGTPISKLLEDHAFYHKQLGTSGENPHMSLYHDVLARRVAEELDLEQPVLDTDYEIVFDKAREYNKVAAGIMDTLPQGKGPFRESRLSANAEPAQRMADYYYRQKRTFTVNDQWETYKENVVKDLRRAGATENAINSVKNMPLRTLSSGPGYDRLHFAERLTKLSGVNGMPEELGEITSAWQGEVDRAYVLFRTLKAGKDMASINLPGESPVKIMQQNIFASSRASTANLEVATQFRQAAVFYGERGDAARAAAYERAADLVTTKGSPNLVKLIQKGSDAVMEAFKGQGGIGKQMSQHIEEIISTGTFPELDALRNESNAKFTPLEDGNPFPHE